MESEGNGTDQRQRLIACTVHPPVPVCEGQPSLAGCSTLDVTLPEPQQIHQITFRNYYTHTVTLWVQRAAAANDETAPSSSGLARPEPWQLAIQTRPLMASAHQEAGSQDQVTFSRKESLTDWRDVLRLRFLLQQPAPHWRRFCIQDIQLLAPPPLDGVTGAEPGRQQWDRLVRNTVQAIDAANGIQVFSGEDGEIVYIGGTYDIQVLQIPSC